MPVVSTLPTVGIIPPGSAGFTLDPALLLKYRAKSTFVWKGCQRGNRPDPLKNQGFFPKRVGLQRLGELDGKPVTEAIAAGGPIAVKGAAHMRRAPIYRFALGGSGKADHRASLTHRARTDESGRRLTPAPIPAFRDTEG